MLVDLFCLRTDALNSYYRIGPGTPTTATTQREELAYIYIYI